MCKGISLGRSLSGETSATVGICMEADEFKNMVLGNSDQLNFMTKLPCLCLLYLNLLKNLKVKVEISVETT